MLWISLVISLTATGRPWPQRALNNSIGRHEAAAQKAKNHEKSPLEFDEPWDECFFGASWPAETGGNWKAGYCCGQYPDHQDCWIFPDVCQDPVVEDDDEALTQAQVDEICAAFCAGSSSPPAWCPWSSPPTFDVAAGDKWNACYGGEPDEDNVDHAKLGKCCGEQPDFDECPFLADACKQYYKDDTKLGDLTETQMEDVCEGYCDAIKETPDWCPGGLPTWAIAVIVVGSVVVVGGAAAVLVYFLVIRKTAAVVGAP
jgi:hypothetical protein